MRVTGDRRILLFGAALLLALTTAGIIGVSMGGIRDSVQFSRVMRRIGFGETDRATLLEAAEYARRPSEWQRLLRIAWVLDTDQRWESVRDIARLAHDRFPRDERWRYAAAYALVRLGAHAEARDLLPLDDLSQDDAPGELLVLLASADPGEPEASSLRLSALAERAASLPILRAVGIAERDGTASALIEAWSLTNVPAYAVNGALEAAVAGDRVRVATVVEAMKESGRVPSAEHYDAPLILALWIGDVDWLFTQLRGLSRRRAFEPQLLLIQAEGNLIQGRLDEARRFYRELQTVDPTYSALAFQNDAAITAIRGDGDPAAIYRRALTHHPRSGLLRGEYAGLLIARDDRIRALRVIAPAVTTGTTRPGRHRDWLLIRAVLGARIPLSRLESDLWEYLNENPDADIVARYLARFVTRRNDSEGIARLVRRYPPDYGEWAGTLHLIALTREGRLSEAETLLEGIPPASWTTHANRVLFVVRHLPLHEAPESLDAFSRFLSRGPELSDEELREAEMTLTLFRAEHARLLGESARASEFAERAMELSDNDPGVQVYRALLAPPH